MAADVASPPPLKWQRIQSLPDAEGFAGMFAGTCGDALLVAGGANFPERRPWEGGTKQWYDAVWQLDQPHGNWQRIGRLPRACAYGISATTPKGIVCAGGANAAGHYADVIMLSQDGHRVAIEALPSLPRPCAMASGALVGKVLYIAGGIERPDATACLETFWALDLDRPEAGWKSLEACPGGPRMLAVAGSHGGDFFLFSGARLRADSAGQPVREYLRDAWRYRSGSGWQRLADLPRAAVAAPSPAPVTNDGRLLVLTGDDGKNVGFKPEAQHPGFPRDVLAYDPASNAWTRLAECPFSRATVPSTIWRDSVIIPSGEQRPGFRSPEVWSLPISVR
jgi:N-acetylneuraminate epimerase